jgi:NADP-dependent 3-hydroxy acid dehydrogenase YdfG
VQRSLLSDLKSFGTGNREEYREKLLALGRLYVRGYEIDWQTLHHGETCRRVSLPSYPFTLERHWVDVSPLPPPREDFTEPENEYFSLRSIWQPRPSSALTTQASPHEVLVFDEGEELARNLAVRWPGVCLLRVIPGEAYQRTGSVVTLRASNEEDYSHLLESASPQVIVYRWSAGSGSIEERLARGIEAVHCLTRSVIRTSPTSVIQFLFVHGSDAPPEVAAIGAFLQTVAEENPKVRVRTVIADAANAGLIDEAVKGDGAREVRYRDGRREVKTFVELSPHNEGIGWFRPKGVYLITGGAGGLGWVFSEHLAQNYQARLVWLGRSELSADQLERIEQLEARGIEVLYVRGDVTRAEEVFETVRQAKARFGTLHGVIHAAGVLRNSFLLHKEIEDLRQVIAAKVFGTLNLDQALKTEPLDAFLLCSSIASVLPEAGQSDYAFANRFLDEFASRREELRAQGLRSGRTLAINWQMWRDGGIVAGLSLEELQTRAEQTVQLTGLPALTAEQGIHLLEQSAQLPTSSGLFC